MKEGIELNANPRVGDLYINKGSIMRNFTIEEMKFIKIAIENRNGFSRMLIRDYPKDDTSGYRKYIANRIRINRIFKKAIAENSDNITISDEDILEMRDVIREYYSSECRTDGTDFKLRTYEIIFRDRPDDLKKAKAQCKRLIKIANARMATYESIKRKMEQWTFETERTFFKGDIIITDPCYICPDDYWDKSEYGRNLTDVGFTTAIGRDTVYGDWSCTTYNSKTRRKIGSFCADAGMVCVALVDDVKRLRPDFTRFNDWTNTVIKNFEGYVYFREHNGEVNVIGEGNINFKTSQSGF